MDDSKLIKCVVESRRAFTLIELLIVIAIIAILAAILLPVLSAAKLRAQQVQCLNNLRQMAMASKMYYDEMQVWVGPINTNNPTLSQGDWMGAMLSYYGHASNVLFCPSAPAQVVPASDSTQNITGTANEAWQWGTEMGAPFAASYAKNDWLEPNPNAALNNASPNGGHPEWLYTSESVVRQPSLTPCFTDSIWINFDPEEIDAPPENLYTGNVNNEGMGRICIARHGGRPAGSAPQHVMQGAFLPGAICIGFVDVHVEPVKLENLWNYPWHLNWHMTGPSPPP